MVNDCEVEHGQVTQVRLPKNLIAGVQVVEYSRAFLYGRLGWNNLGGNLIISGAFGLFNRERCIEVGGYAHDSLGEDMELIVPLRRTAYEDGGAGKIVFLPEPVAWTEVPEDVRVLARQRNRWYRGLLDVLGRHRKMIGHQRYGAAGTIVMPAFVLSQAVAPIVEAARWRLMGYAVVDQAGFRQLTVVWRIWGLMLYLQGHNEWGKQARKGFAPTELTKT